MREVALMLTRAAVAARAEGRYEDARRIGRALAALLNLTADDDAPVSEKTRIGLGVQP